MLLQFDFASQQAGCSLLDHLATAEAKCAYLKSPSTLCSPQGYINYLQLFYCGCGAHPFLGYFLLFLSLLLLFYLLGNTASRYFCSSLESLSSLLNLPPALAGVTLLSLGNGAPDVFSTLVSFSSSSSSSSSTEIGLSSVLGGALFVSTVVVGVISLCVGRFSVPVDRFSFLRDATFLLTVLCFLLGILLIGEITILASVMFVLLYVVYVVAVSVSHCSMRNDESTTPLLESIRIEEPKEETKNKCVGNILYLLELPLYLPRRLTIPDVSEERWSKPYAVASVTLAPVLLAALWNTRESVGGDGELTIYLFAVLLGIVLGMVALETTERTKPPKRFLLPWLAGGFLMSVVWTYITAGELVSLLVSIGHVLGISPSVLGVTVLAWGNSVGDLIANVAMSLNGGANGAQIAISGCYAGPIFNTLVGLGMSLVLSTWKVYPKKYHIARDASVFMTIGFVAAGLIWALVVMPRRGMKVDRVVGIGLLCIYFCFLCLRISQSIGLVNIAA